MVQVNAVGIVQERVGCDNDRAAGDRNSGAIAREREVADGHPGIGRERLADSVDVSRLSRKSDLRGVHSRLPFNDQLVHAGVNGAGGRARFVVVARRQPHGIVLREGRPGVGQAGQRFVQIREVLGGLNDGHAVRCGRFARQGRRLRRLRAVPVRAEVHAAAVGAGLVAVGFERIAAVNGERHGFIRGDEALRGRVPPAQGRLQMEVQG